MNTGIAVLVSYITSLTGRAMDKYAVNDIEQLIGECVDTSKVSCEAVDELLKTVKLNEFIPAIKAYRTLTGAGLKEAKDAIERYRINNSHPEVEKV